MLKCYVVCHLVCCERALGVQRAIHEALDGYIRIKHIERETI